ncbi:hypothetical protein Hte_000456 [Hypoxylon texense]
MSGLEVVGVVLGSIPLLISALEHYGGVLKALHRWRSAAQEIQSLKRRLGTQQAIFTNTCEHLLGGIVSATFLEAMIADPFGPLWRDLDIKCKLEMRLGPVIGPFGDTAASMVEAIKQFQSRLDLNEHGEVKWIEAKALIRELKRATFTIKRSHYNDLLDILINVNQDLKTLTKQSLQLEPERNARYQGRLLLLLRDISKSVYIAVSNSIQCSCLTSHDVSLELVMPNLKSTDKGEQVSQNSVFRCGFSYTLDRQDSGADLRRWRKVLLKLDNSKKLSQLPEASLIQPQSDYPGPKISDKLRFKSVKFAPFGGKTKAQYSSLAQSQPNRGPGMAQPGAVPITTSATTKDINTTQNMVNLCPIKEHPKPPPIPCYGYIADQSTTENSRFAVYPPELHDDYERATFLSMKYILERDESRISPMSYRQRMKLAVDISSSLLQLSGTPWFPDVLTSDDIFFMVRDGVPVYDRAFVARGLFLTAIHQAKPNTTIQSPNSLPSQSLFAVGILLVELLLLRTLNHVWTPDCAGSTKHPMSAELIKDWKSIKDILDQVEVMGGSNYYSAVRRFLFYDFTPENSSQNEEIFYENIYGKTIALLVEDRNLTQF